MRLGAATKKCVFFFFFWTFFRILWSVDIYWKLRAPHTLRTFGPTEPNDNYDDYTTQRTQTQQGRARGKDAYSTYLHKLPVHATTVTLLLNLFVCYYPLDCKVTSASNIYLYLFYKIKTHLRLGTTRRDFDDAYFYIYA